MMEPLVNCDPGDENDASLRPRPGETAEQTIDRVVAAWWPLCVTRHAEGVAMEIEMHEAGAGLAIEILDRHTVGVFRVDPDGSKTLIYQLDDKGVGIYRESRRRPASPLAREDISTG